MKRLLRALYHVTKLSLIPLCVVLTFVYAMLQGGFVSWFLFYSTIPIGLYSLLLPFYALRDAEVKRITNQNKYAAGEQFVSTITIKRKLPFPLLYLVIEDELPPPFTSCKQEKMNKVILFPGLKRNISFQYVIDTIPRGEHTFSSVRVKTGDLFGMIEKKVTFSVPDTFLVYPQYVDIAYRQLENHFEQGALSANINSAKDSTVSVGVRDYKPGDRFSWIDWKATARTNNIMTKEFEQQRSHNIMIFMDRTDSPLFESVVTFTASIVRAVLKQNSPASFVSVGKERTIFPLDNGDTQLQQIFCHLAKAHADSVSPLSQSVEMELRKMYQPVTIILVTSDLSPDIQKAADCAAIKNRKLMVFVVKEKANQLSHRELSILETLQKRKIFVNVVYGNQYTNVFFEVSK
ncbi:MULTISPECIES: DUF58 domain-containing protein [Bacillus cereus group]|uniref:DUF58 domain-containing protein n=1 Tax=Bacillus toyonensis TaxID=155322 RepID=A0AB73SIR9_9BACI|nr:MULTISPECIES: DUF58 domain-containing protein [Bacillus cereus group]MBJ7931229.1 DUF58 domain-containing protein [Bacillus cereus group sp. N31]PEG13185.1 DUF58 domain-containing protein [Bacillus toyonensis]PEI87608.1 DUF58 domain-containing protein [Bacillus toyonensis]PEK07074.1 DUF58 domain-containing protein [Bacillus toyonensis]PEL54287.1 DUF58 domain-containing protein [Bacillus toyonensis]